MNRLSSERKEAALKKLLPPHNLSVSEVAKEEGVSTKTLYNWRKASKLEGKPVPGPIKKTESWSGEAKLATVIETATLTEVELGKYCREKGLYPEQIKAWKDALIQGVEIASTNTQQVKKESKADKKKIRALEKELRQKEKALAETAALLVLRKKLKAFYGEVSEDD